MSIDPAGQGRPTYGEGGGATGTTTAHESYTPTDAGRHPDDGPSAGIMAPHGRPGVYVYPFWQRSEFWAYILTALAVGIAALAADSFDARLAWILITALGVAYILSRGLAKREPRDDDDDQPWTPGGSGGGSSGRFQRSGGYR